MVAAVASCEQLATSALHVQMRSAEQDRLPCEPFRAVKVLQAAPSPDSHGERAWLAFQRGLV